MNDTEIENLITATSKVVSKIKEIKVANSNFRKGSKQDFNFFEGIVRNKTHYEDYHSNFIAYLLKPENSYNCDFIFAKEFIELLNNKSKIKLLNNKIITKNDFKGFIPTIIENEDFKVFSQRNYSNGNSNGRIDITIESNNKWVIFIENKIHASEGKNQIQDYCNWANDKYPNGWCGVFLTKEGYPPDIESSKFKNKVINLSYKDIITWLESSMPKLIRFPQITGALYQYIMVVDKIINPLTIPEMADILKFLNKSPEANIIVQNKDELINAINTYQETKIKNFWNGIWSDITPKLAEAGLNLSESSGQYSDETLFYNIKKDNGTWNNFIIGVGGWDTIDAEGHFYIGIKNIRNDVNIKEKEKNEYEEFKKKLGDLSSGKDWPYYKQYGDIHPNNDGWTYINKELFNSTSGEDEKKLKDSIVDFIYKYVTEAVKYVDEMNNALKITTHD